MTIRDKIIARLATFEGLEFSVSDLAELKRRVKRAKRGQEDTFLYVVVRNWALTKQRKEVAAAKKRQRNFEQAVRDRAAADAMSAAKAEFWPAAQKVIAQWPNSKVSLQMMTLIWLSIFEKKSDAELASTFPGTTPEMRYQWRSRGRRWLRPFASPALWAFVAKTKHNPSSK